MIPTLEYPWSEPPAAGSTIDVAPGVKWLRMPLPFQLNHINLWLVEDGAGWAIVDTGVGLADVRALWERIFDGHLGGRPVTRVVVTHFHPDHMGNAAWLMERWGVELWCAQAEYLIGQVAWRTGEARDNEPRLRHYRRNGCSEAALAALRTRGNHYPKLVPAMPTAFREIRDGDTLDLGGRRFAVIVGRGHSPEHCALWSPETGVLISGDQVLPRITPPGWPRPSTRSRSRAAPPRSCRCSSAASSTAISSGSRSARPSHTCTSSRPTVARCASSGRPAFTASEKRRGCPAAARKGFPRLTMRASMMPSG